VPDTSGLYSQSVYSLV